jgi:hypothetical protein
MMTRRSTAAVRCNAIATAWYGRYERKPKTENSARYSIVGNAMKCPR